MATGTLPAHALTTETSPAETAPAQTAVPVQPPATQAPAGEDPDTTGSSPAATPQQVPDSEGLPTDGAPGLTAGELPPTLEEEVGPLGARMGQGLERLIETGDPQVPTAEETDLVERAKNGEDISEAVPPAGAGPASLPGAAAQANNAVAAANITTAAFQPSGILGMDVSSHQGTVDWRTAWNQGSRFAYAKATEGQYYRNPEFKSQYAGAGSVGMYRGAYHFAIPTPGSGAGDANFFLDNGGMWTADGRTLPPLLDIEYNPYPSLGDTCYNMGPASMTQYVYDFSQVVQARTGRLPVIYTTTDWWSRCTGNTGAFSDHSLHIASYAKDVGPLPNGWGRYAIWQFSSTGPFVGDSNVWYAGEAELAAFAGGSQDPITAKYSQLGGSSGRLGALTRAKDCSLAGGSGCFVMYQGGSIFWTSWTGAQAVYNSGIGSFWWNQGNVTGRLGFPTTDESCGTTVCQQGFEGGEVYWQQSTGNVQVFRTAIGQLWRQQGGGAGILGYPRSEETCGTTVCTMTFDTGMIYWTASSGVASVRDGKISAAWKSRGGQNGRLGYPTGNEACSWGVCTQSFQGGDLVQDTAGTTYAVYRSAIGTTWMAMGGRNSALGIPKGEESCEGTICSQAFSTGLVVWTPASGAWATSRPIFKKWTGEGASAGRLGNPVSPATMCTATTGCRQQFSGGLVLAANTATAAAVVRTGSGIGSTWQRGGAENGRLSYPLADESCEGSACQQRFVNGTIYWTSESGSWPAYNNAITSRWQSLGGGKGRMGYPTSDEFCGAVACWQSFQHGDVLWSTVAGAHGVYSSTAIGSLWRQYGAQYGQFRFPLSEETCGTTSCSQTFEGGTISWDTRTGLAVDFR
ncbi:hypothetical protein LJ754_00835 [Arthrobacter sp. zg-Y40]|uniref:GH25 family lysozyme n=1 Tax=Arthrobacter sp. zg-Y40 TaxID=2886939 RepID=UPI001D14284D|nr:GH25 family lysozyme [Arthrobacter sp. zg-Y40]MCC3277709.1 hypothetical protein [Arthrobacter sp. zg-Y40]